MKIRVPVMVEVHFDIDDEDRDDVDTVKLAKQTGQSVLKVFRSEDLDWMVDQITDETGWCITALSVTLQD